MTTLEKVSEIIAGQMGFTADEVAHHADKTWAELRMEEPDAAHAINLVNDAFGVKGDLLMFPTVASLVTWLDTQ